MKFYIIIMMWLLMNVTPLAGVWIEIFTHGFINVFRNVTPLAGVWIEISYQPISSNV